jgi:hypothetical protein
LGLRVANSQQQITNILPKNIKIQVSTTLKAVKNKKCDFIWNNICIYIYLSNSCGKLKFYTNRNPLIKMKKTSLFFACVTALAVTMIGCKKEEAAPVVPKVTFDKDIKPIIVANCGPCHLTGGTQANKWENYAETKAKVASILDRIQRMPTAAGFMPRGKTAAIPTASIDLIKQWQTDGLLEK